MNRALPLALLIHLTALLLIFLFGTWVDRPSLTPARTLNVKVVTLPVEESETEPPVVEQDEPVEVEPDIAPEPEPEPEIVEPEPVKIPQPVSKDPEPEVVEEPPAEKPAVTPDPEPKQEEDPKPKPEVVVAAPQKTEITGTDQDVPPQYQYYMNLLQGQVARNWDPRRLGFREGNRHCVIYFAIERDGRLTRESVEKSSGVSLFDREALNAIRRVRSMPPLPSGIRGASLGIHYTFTLEKGS